jgi:hypothetical protein
MCQRERETGPKKKKEYDCVVQLMRTGVGSLVADTTSLCLVPEFFLCFTSLCFFFSFRLHLHFSYIHIYFLGGCIQDVPGDGEDATEQNDRGSNSN